MKCTVSEEMGVVKCDQAEIWDCARGQEKVWSQVEYSFWIQAREGPGMGC